ncbi:MAG: hypothetical protein KJ755_13505 [Alphaproteobacteria bacterium]|nr:hypothetical protein [Alphaproteobacteria bacterium]
MSGLPDGIALSPVGPIPASNLKAGHVSYWRILAINVVAAFSECPIELGQCARKTPLTVKRKLQEADPKTGKAYEALYERLLDFGAHPNEKGFSMSSNIRRENGDIHIDALYLHGDGTPLDLALKTTAQVGICVLRIARILYPQRFKEVGLDAALDAIMKVY